MSKRTGGFIGQDGLNAPDPATGVTGTAGDAQVDVSFTSPSDVGGAAVTGYRVQSNDGIGASGSASPITVTGLTNGTSYTFNVWAINPLGWSSPSDASGSVSPAANMVAFMGGNAGATSYNVIDFFNVNTTGNATDWGNLGTSRGGGGAASNATRGLVGGGGNPVSSSTNTARIDYITWASTGNSAYFGNLTLARYYKVGGVSNDTRGVFVTGRNSSFQGSNVMDYVTLASTGNATDFGNLTAAKSSMSGASNSHGGLS